MRRLAATIGWRLPGKRGGVLDPRVVELVSLAVREGSLAAAAREARMPYRTAWALLDEAEDALGQRLLVLERGVGAVAAPLGERLLEARQEARRVLDARRDKLDVPLVRTPGASERPGLAIAASHDLVLAELRDAWSRQHAVTIAFHGSEVAIAYYLEGRVDLAGFHFPLVPAPDGPDALVARLDRKRDAVLPFLIRTQGLILPRGNPERVRTLADVVEKKLRLCNRQPGSGTRLTLEQLLARDRLRPADVVGWTHEEFTHAAVAATVAAGEADVGFGIQAAAVQLGLAFVPLSDERYAFACRRSELAQARLRAFRNLLASTTVEKVVAPLAGYRLVAGGEALAIGRL